MSDGQILYQKCGDFIHDLCLGDTSPEDVVQVAMHSVDVDDVCAVCGEPAILPESAEDAETQAP